MNTRDLFDIRHISHFENGNPYTGSVGLFRYTIKPTKEGTMQVAYWVGETSSLDSEMEENTTVSLDADGREAAIAWLVQQYEKNRLRCMR